MSATQWGLVCLAAACIALAVAVVRLSTRLSEASARAAAELDAVRRELSGLEQGRSTLERLSATDPATGVWNHRYLLEALGREIERARRVDKPLTVLMCDIDHFGAVNAEHGHQTGTAVLRQLAQRLALEIRSFDTFARYGGEEFVVVLPDTGAEGAAIVAERLCYAARKLVPDARAVADGEVSATLADVRLTVSIGGAVYPAGGAHAATLLRAADGALSEAKAVGGNTWILPGGAGRPLVPAIVTSLS